MSRVYIGIGSNLGNREENCARAVALLEIRGCNVVARSSLYDTAPWGVADQPRFINMAIAIETSTAPRQLLHLLKETEAEVGRTAAAKWGPRVIDLDILLYADLVVETDDLIIPHPLMHKRLFVLDPLAEIAQDAEHPVLHKTIGELRSTLTA